MLPHDLLMMEAKQFANREISLFRDGVLVGICRRFYIPQKTQLPGFILPPPRVGELKLQTSRLTSLF
jgi:hypothetical protein